MIEGLRKRFETLTGRLRQTAGVRSPEQAEALVKPGAAARGAVGVGRRADVAGILLLPLIARADH
jgi:hypothetical protein